MRPLKAIRENCKRCTSDSLKAIRECLDKTCPLWSYRMGNNPNRKKSGKPFTKDRNPRLNSRKLSGVFYTETAEAIPQSIRPKRPRSPRKTIMVDPRTHEIFKKHAKESGHETISGLMAMLALGMRIEDFKKKEDKG